MVQKIEPYWMDRRVTLSSRHNGNTTYTQNFQRIIVGNNVQSGSSLSDYQTRIKRGQSATTSYTREIWDVVPGSLVLRTTFKNFFNDRDDYYTQRFFEPIPQINIFRGEPVIDIASNRLKSKLRSHTGQSNQLVNLVEARELPRMITTTARSALDFTMLVTDKRKRMKPAAWRNYFSEQWLNWSFGIAPTLGAIDDAVQSINRATSQIYSQRDYGVAATAWMERALSTSSGPYGVLIDFIGMFKYSYSCKFGAGFSYKYESGNSYHTGKHFGFDIGAVVPTAWELTPFSWMADYFGTAGAFLEDTFHSPSGDTNFLYRNTRYVVEGEVQTKVRNLGCNIITDISKPCKFKFVRFNRTPLSNLPRTALRFKTSHEIGHNVVNKLLNLVSILGTKK